MNRTKLSFIALMIVFAGSFGWLDSQILGGGAAYAQQAPASGEAMIRVFVGRSLVINSPEPLARVSVTNPDIAKAVVTSPRQVLLHGLTPGVVSLLLWDEQNRTRSLELRVEIDIDGLRAAMSKLYPSEQLEVSQLGSSIVLSGVVPSPEVAEKLVNLAKTHSPNVVNMLDLVPRQKNKAVLLQVRFAEVDRGKLNDAGINFFSTGLGNTIGTIGTQQFGAIASSGNVGEGQFRLTDLLNIFLFNQDIDLGVTIKALEQRSLLQILAEPNVLALDGKEASFLAGGEFPFPVIQGGANVGAVTIQFREFGIRLNFTPNIQDDGAIRLRVNPEVSQLDYANALVVSGFTIPAISTRRADSEIELRDGQSFALAGLIDHRLVEVSRKIPGLGDIPGLGYLFRSKSANITNTELLVMVTPRLVMPFEPGQAPSGPEFPKPVESSGSQGAGGFEGNTGEAAPAGSR